VWVDPDIGGGQVLVQLHAPAGARPQVEVGAVPLDGHRGALRVPGERGGPGRPVAADTWLALVPFDSEGSWALTVRLDGPAGTGELRTSADAVPDGPTAGEVWIYVLPFVLLAGLWVVGRIRGARGVSAEE
jgi:hypothetical protein